MADFSELALAYRVAIQFYPWRRIDPVPWAPPRDARSSRVALVTSAGLHRRDGDAPFAPVRGGDTSVRMLPADVALDQLVVGQTSDAFDRSLVDLDRNAAFPLARLAELHAAGEVGGIAPRHLSFNGSITAPGRLVASTAPAAAAALRADGVDAAVLVPI